jgi:hypothetical protein
MQRNRGMSTLDIIRNYTTHLVFCSSNTTTIKRLGRGIPKIVSLFGDIRNIIDDADKHSLRLEGELDAELDDMNEAEAAIIKEQ